jgi:hypothetical protein
MNYLIISIDVEPDCTSNWRYSDPLTFKGVTIGIKDILQPLFEKYKIKPTYLINNVVLEDCESIEILRTLNTTSELGTHLHPEFIEPEKSVFNYANSKGEANCSEYSNLIEFQKIKNITNLFYNKFNYYPTAFRAGRFSAGENTFESISKLGYKVDSSITPNICWNDRTRKNPIDFRKYGYSPFFINEKLLEIPVTIIKKKESLKNIIINLFKGKFKLHNTIWLRPYFSNFSEMKNIFLDIEKESNGKDVVLNMMFHNVEIMPKLSPYSNDENDCKEYLRNLELFLEFCVSKKIKSVTLSEFYDIYKK